MGASHSGIHVDINPILPPTNTTSTDKKFGKELGSKLKLAAEMTEDNTENRQESSTVNKNRVAFKDVKPIVNDYSK